MGALGRSLVALAGLAAAFPVSAQAGGTYTVDQGDFGVPDGGMLAGQGECPGSNDFATSGGSYTPYALGETWLSGSRPGLAVAPTNFAGWAAQEINRTGGAVSGDATITAYAICHINGEGDYKVRRKSDIKLKDNKQNVVLRSCKDGEAVVGGGAITDATAGPLMALSTTTPYDDGDRDKQPDGWKVAMEAFGLDTTVHMDVYAVCDKKRSPKKYRYLTEQIELADGQQDSVTAICDVLEPRVGGGVETNGKFQHGLRINSNYPDGGSGWTSFMDNIDTDDENPRKVTATAICRKI